MMFHVMRSWYKYGREGDEVMITDKYYDTIEKALAYAERYAKGIRFVMVQIETDDDDMELIYEYLADGGRCTIDKTAKYKIAAESQEEPAEKQEETTESQEAELKTVEIAELKTIETDEQIEQNCKNKLYEFYIDGGILIYCDKCRKSKNNFLHLYQDDKNVGAIDLSIFSISFLCKSKCNTIITFVLERNKELLKAV